MKYHYQIVLSDSIRYAITGLLLVAYPYKIPHIISPLMIPQKNELLIITSLIVLAAAITPLIISTNFEGRSVIMQISYAQQNVCYGCHKLKIRTEENQE
jgi:hypothetical protein